jgi:hypothetical protein
VKMHPRVRPRALGMTWSPGQMQSIIPESQSDVDQRCSWSTYQIQPQTIYSVFQNVWENLLIKHCRSLLVGLGRETEGINTELSSVWDFLINDYAQSSWIAQSEGISLPRKTKLLFYLFFLNALFLMFKWIDFSSGGH